MYCKFLMVFICAVTQCYLMSCNFSLNFVVTCKILKCTSPAGPVSKSHKIIVATPRVCYGIKKIDCNFEIFETSRQVRKVLRGSTDEVIDKTTALDVLERYFSELNEHAVAGIQKATSYEQIMKNTLGFSIRCSPSKISGTGVFVSSGYVKKGSLVSMYPGTVYHACEPIFFQSLANSFVFRCIDGMLIDGKDRGLSRMIYRSCAQRDLVGHCFTCDMSWLTPSPYNLLGIGQYVNNGTRDFPANVTYQELDIPSSFPLQYLKYIPNANYSFKTYRSEELHVRTVVLVALRDIEESEELFSSYFTVLH